MKRFKQVYASNDMIEDSEGDWVRWEDAKGKTLVDVDRTVAVAVAQERTLAAETLKNLQERNAGLAAALRLLLKEYDAVSYVQWSAAMHGAKAALEKFGGKP